MLWSDIWSTVASGKSINQQQLRAYGNPYSKTSNGKQVTTSTLQSLVNLKKNSLKLSRNADTGKYSLDFSFDASTQCMVRIYCKVKEVVVVDSKTGAPKGTKNVIFRSNDNSPPYVKTFGPYPPGLHQTFTTPTEDAFESSHFYAQLDDSDESLTESTSLNEPGTEDVEMKKKKILPFLFNFCVVLETFVPALADGLDKASKQGMPNPVNSQSTYISINSTTIPGSFECKIQKQRIVIDSVSYLLQEIYGFLDDENNSGTGGGAAADEDLLSSTRDCVICMCEARDTIVLPCRHLCLCRECAHVLRSQGRAAIPANATVGGGDGIRTAMDTPETPVNTPATPAPSTAMSALNSFSLFGHNPPIPTRQSVGPPRCPICRQIFHSLLQINLPTFAEQPETSIDI